LKRFATRAPPFSPFENRPIRGFVSLLLLDVHLACKVSKKLPQAVAGLTAAHLREPRQRLTWRIRYQAEFKVTAPSVLAKLSAMQGISDTNASLVKNDD